MIVPTPEQKTGSIDPFELIERLTGTQGRLIVVDTRVQPSDPTSSDSKPTESLWDDMDGKMEWPNHDI